MPLSNVVFLYPSKSTNAAMRGCLFFMVDCIGQPVKRLAASFGGSFNPIQSAAQSLKPLSGGLSLFKGITMLQNQSVSNPQTKTVSCLFSVFHHRKLIAQNITGLLALRFKRRYPAIVVKFAQMEVSA
ncbi:MAG: hypothetical protein NTV00_02875 [Methylococcales bacterium]|nr:hypothetical protein [Methylococcales bacterium]